MKKTVKVVVVVSCLATMCMPAFAAFGNDDLSFNLTSDFYSKYVWRGQLLNDDPVFQPGITVGYKGFTFGAWGNADLTDYTGNSGEFTEWDYTLSYGGKFSPDSKLSYTIGVIHYQFPSSFLDTTEIFWGLTYDTFLNPSITVYHDIDEAGGGIYANFGISHTIDKALKLSESVSADLVLGASVGWGNDEYNEWYWGVDNARFNDLTLKASLPIDLGNGWSVTPNFSYVMLIDGNIRDTDAYATNSNYFIAGVSIGKSF